MLPPGEWKWAVVWIGDCDFSSYLITLDLFLFTTSFLLYTVNYRSIRNTRVAPQTCKIRNTRGILWTWKTRGILGEFHSTSGKNCNKQNGVTRCCFGRRGGQKCSRIHVQPGLHLRRHRGACDTPSELPLLRLFFVAVFYEKVSLWLGKTRGMNFLPTLWPRSNIQMSLKDSLLSVSLFCHLASIILCALILSETLALYKSFTYLRKLPLRLWAEMVPWAGLTAAEIQHEILGVGNELDLSSPRVASDPYNTVLSYGLSRNPDQRLLSLEQIRDLLSEHLMVLYSHLHCVTQPTPLGEIGNKEGFA